MEQAAEITDILSDEAIQTGADIKKQTNDETILYALLIIAIGNQRMDKLPTILDAIGKGNLQGEREVDDYGRTPFDYLIRCKDNAPLRKLVLGYCNQEQLRLYAAKLVDIERQVACIKAALTLDEIQTAIEIRDEKNNYDPLKFFFAKSVFHADVVKMQLIIGEIGDQFQFDFEINAKGTSPLDYLARCKDPKFIQTALIYCTEEEKQLYEQKKSNQPATATKSSSTTAKAAPSSAPASTKLSDKNFHKDTQAANKGANRAVAPQQETQNAC